MFRDRVSLWRALNAVKIAQKTEAKLGSQPESGKKYAHPRIVAQVIEQGSWIDAEDVQELWGGLLASSCTVDGRDDSNLTFIDLLLRLTASQARIFEYVCQNARKKLSLGGWLIGAPMHVSSDKLQEISGLSDVYRLDLELDNLGNLGLIDLTSGFQLDSREALLTPTNLALQMYARCQGFAGNPLEFYNLSIALEEDQIH